MFIASSSLVALLNSVVSPPPREKESCDNKLFAGQGRREQEEQLRESLMMLWYQVLLYTGKTSQAHVDLEPMYGFLDRQVIV